MRRKQLKNLSLLFVIFVVLEVNVSVTAHAEDIALKNNQEQIIVVDKNREGDYTTIQEAVNNAPESSTIYVKTGTYNEIINIKRKINLIGEDRNKTIINPISEENKYAIRLGAPEIKISKLSITNGAPGLYTTGVHISASKTEIRDCNIHDTPIGIAIWTSDNTINNCNFWRCKDEGIALIGSTHSKCNNNKITNCIFHDNCDGIELQYSSNNTINNCELYSNTHTGIDAIASSNNKNTISNCKIYNNEVHGIYLSASSDNQIINCSISNNNDGNIITTKNSYNNNIKNSNTQLENNEAKQAEASYTYYNSNKETSKKDNIIDQIFNAISNLNMYKMIYVLVFS